MGEGGGGKCGGLVLRIWGGGCCRFVLVPNLVPIYMDLLVSYLGFRFDEASGLWPCDRVVHRGIQDLPAPDSHQTSPPCALLSPLLPKVKTEKGSLRGIACDITRAVKWVWHLKCRNLGNDASKTLDADEESRVTTAACGLAVKF